MPVSSYPPSSGDTPQVLGYAEVTANQTGISTEADLAGLTTTVTVAAGRRIRITAYVLWGRSVTSDGTMSLRIREGGVQITQTDESSYGTDAATAFASVIVSPTAGTHTYKVTMQRPTGTGTLSLLASAIYPAYILVEDITGFALPTAPTSVPVGVLARAERNAGQEALPSGTSDLPGLSVNVTVPEGRTLRVSMFACISTVTIPSETQLYMDGVKLNRFYFTSSNGSIETHSWDVVVSPAAGSHTFKAMVAIGGTGLVYNDAGNESYIMVEDITPTPALASGAPSSTLGYAENTSLAQAVTTTTDLTGLFVTVTVPAGRRLKITAHAYVNQSGANQRSQFSIQEGATHLEGAYLNHSEAGVNESIEVTTVVSPSAGMHTYKVTGNVDAGTSTFGGAATNPAFILVEDITGVSYNYTQPGFLPAHSSSRPSNPEIGAAIYETDTGKAMVYNGSGWGNLVGGGATTLAYAEVLTNQGSIAASSVDLTGLSITITVPAGRRIRLSSRAYFTSTTSDGDGLLAINEGATQLQESRGYVGGTVQPFAAEPVVIITPSAGTHTYKLVAKRVTGTGTLTSNAWSAGPAFIMAEDITGAAAPYGATSVPVGVLAQVQHFAGTQQINSGSIVDLTGSDLNISVPAGRLVRLSAKVHGSATGAAETRMRLAITEGGSIIAAAYRVFSGANFGEDVSLQAVISPSAGAHTYKLGVSRDNSSSAVTIYSAVSEPSIFVAEDITPTPATATTAPSSTLGYAEVVADQGSISIGGADLTGLATTITVPAGRRIKITAKVLFKSTVASDRADLQIREGGDVHQIDCAHLPIANAEQSCRSEVILTPSAGSHTYKLWANRSTGSGTVTMSASGDWPAFILVEDITSVSVEPTAIVPGALVVTSATRPSGVAVGTQIYETDTARTYLWNGSAWIVDHEDTGWLPVTLLNGWTVYGDGNYGTINMYRRYKGVVYLRGLLVSTSASNGIAFNLPAGFRPAGVTRLFAAFADNSIANRHDVGTDGNVSGPTGRGWVSFAGIQWIAEQ